MVQGLLNYFLQAIHCGALQAGEVEGAINGPDSREELRVGSAREEILARRSA